MTFAAPGYFEYNNHGKSIFSSISKPINHERSHDLHSPVLATHDAEYNAQLDKTATKGIPVVNHSNIVGLRTPVVGAQVLQAPILSTSVVHTAVVSAPAIHAPVVSAPVIHVPVVSVPVVHAPVYSSLIVSN